MDMYLCHADTNEITEFINQAYTASKDSVFVISVANLQTNYIDAINKKNITEDLTTSPSITQGNLIEKTFIYSIKDI